MASRRISLENLERFIAGALTAVGVPGHVAEVEAQVAAEVDLCGVHTHGSRLLRMTVENVRNGLTNGNPRLETVKEFPASMLLEADRGIGRYTSAMGMDLAIARAASYGVGCVSVRGVAHWGRGHSYALRAARAGMVGLAFTNAFANFPAWGTRVPSLGNNPMAIGIPGGDEDPVVLDLAMTQAAIGRVQEASARGQTVPLGWGLDVEGRPTEDPEAILASRRFLPMGEHKGSGLAFVIDLLTGGLAGGLLCFEQGTEGRPTDSVGGSTKLFMAVRPFDGWLTARVADLKAHLKSAPPAPEQGEAQWPGEGSFRRRAEYMVDGIPLPDGLARDLDDLARGLSVELHWSGPSPGTR